MACSMHVAVALLGVGFASVASAEEVSLAAHLQEGESSRYAYSSELSQSPTGPFGEVFYVNYALEFGTTVTRITEQYTDLDLVFSRIVIDSTLGEFDSSAKGHPNDGNLVGQAFRPAIGKTFGVRLDSQNMRMIGTTGPDTGYVPDMMIQLYNRVLGEKHLIEMLQPAFRLRADPTTGVPGDTWSDSVMRGGNVGTIEIRLDLTLTSVEEGVATVEIGGEHLIRLEQDTPVSQRIVEQLVEGTAVWSVTEGLLREFGLEKSFTLAAGDERFDLGSKVIERGRLTRTE